MITLNQIRAARGLLNWSQSDLARHAGLSLTAVNAIDRELSQPRVRTLATFEKLFESHGIEFTQGQGVRFRKDVFRMETFEGPESFAAYMRDVVETQLDKGGESLHSCVDEAFFLKKHRKIFYDYYAEFTKHKMKERILICEGTLDRYGPRSTTEYRWCSKELYTQIGSSVYGDKYCIYLPNRIVVIENTDIAQAYRKQFEENWRRSKIIPHAQSGFEQDLEKLKKLKDNHR